MARAFSGIRAYATCWMRSWTNRHPSGVLRIKPSMQCLFEGLGRLGVRSFANRNECVVVEAVSRGRRRG